MPTTKWIVQIAPPSELKPELILGISEIDFCALVDTFPGGFDKPAQRTPNRQRMFRFGSVDGSLMNFFKC
jgi:hypothetical protein